MSFIGTAFFASKLLITFCTSSGQVGDKKKDVRRFDAAEVFGAARIVFSIWLANFSSMDEKYLLKVLAISEAVVSDDPSSFCTLLIMFVCFFPLLSISLKVDHNFLELLPFSGVIT